MAEKYLISGYDYSQDMILEAGTYTIIVTVKSMFGNTYSFSLFNGTDWELFDIETIQGEWKKSFLTFTIKERKTKLNPIARYYDETNKVFVQKIIIVKGNVPSEAGASPFDIDQITDDLHDQIVAISDFTNKEFADRVLDASERISLKRDLESVETIFQSLKGSYDKLIINPYVTVETLSDLTTKYNAVVSSKESLFTVINTIISGDNIISDDEILAKDNALLAFNAALYNYNTAEKEIANVLGNDYTQKIGAIRDFTDKEFADRVLSNTEKISLSHDLDNVQLTIDSVTANCNEILLNENISTENKTLLTDKYNALLDAWDWDYDLDPSKPDGLKTVITDIINGDNIVSQEEIDEKDLALSAFNTALSEYSTIETRLSKGIKGEDGHSPYIENGTWWLWDIELNAFKDSGLSAQGDEGHSPYIDTNTQTWWEWDVTLNTYKDTGIKAKGDNSLIYSLLPTASSIKKDKNGNYDIATIGCKLLKTDGTTTTQLSSTPAGYEMRYYLDDSTGYGVMLPNSTIPTSSVTSKIEFRLYKDTLIVDSETVLMIIDGSDNITADLDNSMASFKTDANGNVTSGLPIVSTFSLSKGSTPITLDSLAVAPVTGVTVSANKDTGKVTVTAITSAVADVINLQITGVSGTISKTLTLTINRIKDGADGDGIISTTTEYANSQSGTEPPSVWYTTAPAPVKGSYLWIRTTTKYKKSADTIVYSVSYYGTDGSSGAGIQVIYKLGNSTPATPTGDAPSGWLTSAPSPTSSNKYVYSSTRTRPQGGAWTVWSPPVEHTRYVTDGSTGKGVSSVINWFYKSSSKTELINGAWSEAKPDYSDSFYLWTKTVTTYTDNSTSETSAILDPEWHKVLAITDRFGFVVNGGLISPVRMDLREANSTEVTAGLNGIQKTKVATYTEYEFGLSSLNSIPPTSWQETPPTRTAGYYLWMRFGTGAGDTKPTSWTNQLIEDGLNKYIELSADRLSWHRMPFVTGDQYMRTVDNGVTSDIKKIINENVPEYLPSIWSGGTYEQAVAFNDFMRNFYNGTSTAANYDQLANIVMMHNGLSKMGDFIVDENGNIIIVDAATGKKRILFSATNLPDLDTLLSTIAPGESVQNNPVENPSFNLSNDINVTVDGADITFKTDGVTLANAYSLYAQYSSIDPPFVTLQSYLYLMKDGVYYDTIGFLEISNDSNSAKMSINRSWSNCPKGNYSVRGILEPYEPEPGLVISNIKHSIGYTTLSWSFVQADVRRFQFGLDGFMAIYPLLHLYLSETYGLDIKGPTNMPGVLLSGTVASGGGIAAAWGAKQSATNPVNNSTGKYTVYHTVGHSNYQVNATPNTSSKTCHIVSKGTNNFVIEWRTVGSTPALSNTGFDFQIIGNNYA